jgi:hypothetical protein
VSLEAAAAYVEYENTQINPMVAILVETILILNHCREDQKRSNEMLHEIVIYLDG